MRRKKRKRAGEDQGAERLNFQKCAGNIWYYSRHYHSISVSLEGTMKRFLFAAIILSVALSNLAFGEINEPMTAKEWYEQYGQGEVIGGGMAAASTPGTLWDNGPNNLVDGLSSEAGTFVSGTGGPEGDHGSTIADDFLLTVQSELTEIRVCFFSDTPTAELYIYADNGGMPGPSVTVSHFWRAHHSKRCDSYL